MSETSTATWADNTTQDRLEATAKEHGWAVVASTSEKTVLYHNHRVLTITFSTRERDGQIFTAITGWTLQAGHWSTSKGYQVANLIDRYGTRRKTPEGSMASNSPYDYALDCVDCGQIYVFGTDEERSRERENHHSTHEVDYFRQGRV